MYKFHNTNTDFKTQLERSKEVSEKAKCKGNLDVLLKSLSLQSDSCLLDI